jgi:hypothetical protein
MTRAVGRNAAVLAGMGGAAQVLKKIQEATDADEAR